jgi:hypothetical protein
MPQQTVGVEAVRIAEGIQRPVIRNLGPGEVGIDTSDEVTTANASIYLKVDESYEFPEDIHHSGWGNMYAISDTADTDLRIAEVG